MTTQDKINLAHFDLVEKSIRECFEPIKRKRIQYVGGYRDESDASYYRRKVEVVKRRLNFTDTYLFGLWCDCSHNFEEVKLRKKIVSYNMKLV